MLIKIPKNIYILYIYIDLLLIVVLSSSRFLIVTVELYGLPWAFVVSLIYVEPAKLGEGLGLVSVVVPPRLT